MSTPRRRQRPAWMLAGSLLVRGLIQTSQTKSAALQDPPSRGNLAGGPRPNGRVPLPAATSSTQRPCFRSATSICARRRTASPPRGLRGAAPRGGYATSTRAPTCTSSGRCRASAAELEAFLTEGKQDRAQIGTWLNRSSSAEGTLRERNRRPLRCLSRQRSAQVCGGVKQRVAVWGRRIGVARRQLIPECDRVATAVYLPPP